MRTQKILQIVMIITLVMLPMIVFGQDDWGFAEKVTDPARRVYRIVRTVLGLLAAADVIWIIIKISNRDNNLKIQIIGLLVLIAGIWIVPAILSSVAGININ